MQMLLQAATTVTYAAIFLSEATQEAWEQTHKSQLMLELQASQQMLATLKSIEAEAKKLATEAVTKVETVAEKVENKVISIADAVKKEL